MSQLKWLSFFLILFSLGCANHHCRMKQEGVSMESSKAQGQSTLVLVAKPDGSQQCEEKSGIKLEDMAKDLGDIQIFRKFKKNDGLMRIQVCGAPTGMHNIYEIDVENLQKAQDVGFKTWKGPKN